MDRRLTAIALVVGVALAGGASAPARDGLARLRAFGRPVQGGGGPRILAFGPVTAVDDRSVTIRSWFEMGFENAKEEDESGTGRFGRRVRRNPIKPIILSWPGWEVDCDSIRYTPEGMVVTVVTQQEVLVRNADRPARRFPATPELFRGAPHVALPNPGRRQCHLLHELRVGDEVQLFLAGPAGREECAGVTIWRRPGGRVPHSTVAPESFREAIDGFNAYQAHEENGTPIPEPFRRDLQRLRRPPFPGDEAPAVPPPKRP
ncbi:hypothetical protein J0H58_30890 [bacterium]|nr:hypothetical protein [bacterium]